mmetsp:Transcript_1421/g.2992  ORF Transcript_1421/g.2992 Transcript_1421/m.2992 type:complete len:648 (+) Transcript_1421:52-1995(+)
MVLLIHIIIMPTIILLHSLHTILKVLELPLHLIHNVSISTGDFRRGALGIHVLAINHLLDDGGKARLDVSIGELGIRGRIRNRLLAEVVEGDDHGKHAHRLGKGTGEIMLREGILGEEILTKKLGHLHDHLLILRQGLLTNQLHNLREVILLLQNVTSLVTQVRITGIHVVEVRLQHLHVLGVRDEPVERRKVLALRELLVESPKDLHDGERGGRDGIGKVTAGRTDGSHHRHGSLAIGRAQTRDTSGTLVKGGETSTKVSGVATIGRHLPKTSRNLTKSLGPTTGTIPHHGHVHALIAKVLGEGDSSVNGSLAGRHGHVGRVGHEGGTLHDTHFLLLLGLLVLDGHGELGEITEDFRHFVSALAAADVDNYVTVTKLGKRLRNNSFSTSKRTGNGARSSQHGGEEAINDTESSDEGNVTGKLFGNGPGTPHGPKVAQGQVVRLVLGFVVDLHDDVVDKEGFVSIGSRGMNLGDRSVNIGRHQNPMRMNNLILIHNPHDISPRHRHALLNHPTRRKSPPNIPRQARNIHALGHVNIPRVLKDVLQRPLNTVENGPHDPRTQFHAERLLLPQDGIADGQAGGVLVDLDGGRVAFELDDFSDEFGVADADEFVHCGAGHVVGDDEGSGDLEDEAVVGFLFVFVHGEGWF